VRSAPRDLAGTRSRRFMPFVVFDLEPPETVAPALEGVRTVCLSGAPRRQGGGPGGRPLHRRHEQRGVWHVVNFTALDIDVKPHARALRQIELQFEASALAWTHLRPNFFMQILLGGGLLAGNRVGGEIHLPAAGARISYLAAVSAAMLLGPGHLTRAMPSPASLPRSRGGRAGDRGGHEPSGPLHRDRGGRDARDSAQCGPSGGRMERLIRFCRLVRDVAAATVSPDMRTVPGRAVRSFAAAAAAPAHAEAVAAPRGRRAWL